MSQPNTQKEYYCLYIDELGTASPKDLNSEVYVLSGCSVKRSECINLKTWADQIKFKYWGRTDIVWHSHEIGRKKNEFAIFTDSYIYEKFLADLKDFLLFSKYKMFFIVVDKNKARSAGWDDKKVHKDTTAFLIRNFLLILLTTDSKGEIIIEASSVSKDVHLMNSLNYFLSGGLPKLGITNEDVQNTLTSVSFVTKKNHDIEEQIADLFAYAAKIKYQSVATGKSPKGDYEKMMVEILDKKVFAVPTGAKRGKAKLFKEVDPFLIIP